MAGRHSKCELCLYWQDQNIIGLCRRYPQYHNKHRTEWCGEWTSIPNEAPIELSPLLERTKRKYTRRQDVEASA